MPRAKSKALLQMEAAFVVQVGELVVSLGGIPQDHGEFAIQTKAGRLDITPYPEFIAGRFDDVERAKALFGVFFINQGRLNPYSGKWNFGQGMLFDTTVATRGAEEAAVLDQFTRELSAIGAAGPVDPPSGRPTIAGVLKQMRAAASMPSM